MVDHIPCVEGATEPALVGGPTQTALVALSALDMLMGLLGQEEQ